MKCHLSRRQALALGLAAGWSQLPLRAQPRQQVAPPQSRTSVGVNVAGAEFGELDGKKNFKYVYADDKYITWCIDQGFKIIRLPFKWARMMPSHDAQVLHADDFKEVQRIARLCTARGVVCLLDMHDYGRYRAKTLGDPALPADFFPRTWQLIAAGMPRQNVWFGLMNEPHDQDMDQAMGQFQAAAHAIRRTGHEGRILVPSGGWSGAHSFVSGGNVERFERVEIPGDWSIDLHQYLDPDNSGTKHDIHVPGKGESVLRQCTAALKANKWTAVLGEYGWSDSPEGNKEGADLVSFMHREPEVWIGHAYWASGPWWGKYPYAIGPEQSNGQLAVLTKFM